MEEECVLSTDEGKELPQIEDSVFQFQHAGSANNNVDATFQELLRTIRRHEEFFL